MHIDATLSTERLGVPRTPQFRRGWIRLAAALLAVAGASPLAAQISLTTAVDLALRSSPRVLVAQADVAKAIAVVQEARDAYVPNLSVGGSGYGRSAGYPLGQPTIFDVNAQSLVFSFSQKDYIRAARAGLESASLALAETREAVAEDTVLTFLALDHDLGREAALQQQQGFAQRLVGIIQDRLNAGQDTAIDLTGSRLAAAQIRLKLVQAQNETEVDRTHLAHLTGLPGEGLTIVRDSMPGLPAPSAEAAAGNAPTSPAISAAFAAAHSKREQAFGDARYLLRPQVSFAAQYSRISTYNNANYLEYFGRRDPAGNLLPFPSNSVGAGIQVTLPVLDYAHRARARAAAADAVHAERDAEYQRSQFLEGRLRLHHSALELAARADIAELDQQLAQQQLEILLLQLSGPGQNGTPLTPKDEQNSRVTERDKYLNLLDARFQLQQAQVNLLRQTGGLAAWLQSIARQTPGASPALTAKPTSQP